MEDSIDSNNDSDNRITLLLKAGLFEYLQTISIVDLLTSSRVLYQYQGILIIYCINVLLIITIRYSTKHT